MSLPILRSSISEKLAGKLEDIVRERLWSTRLPDPDLPVGRHLCSPGAHNSGHAGFRNLLGFQGCQRQTYFLRPGWFSDTTPYTLVLSIWTLLHKKSARSVSVAISVFILALAYTCNLQLPSNQRWRWCTLETIGSFFKILALRLELSFIIPRYMFASIKVGCSNFAVEQSVLLQKSPTRVDCEMHTIAL